MKGRKHLPPFNPFWVSYTIHPKNYPFKNGVVKLYNTPGEANKILEGLRQKATRQPGTVVRSLAVRGNSHQHIDIDPSQISAKEWAHWFKTYKKGEWKKLLEQKRLRKDPNLRAMKRAKKFFRKPRKEVKKGEGRF